MSLGPYVCVFLIEHLHFRKRKFARYDVPSWDIPSQLPLGAAALGASVVGFGLAIPTINQPWYTGTVAVKFGDAGFAVSMLVTAIFYTPLRHLEIRWKGV
jgi:purine-cytosine permease-like protein